MIESVHHGQKLALMLGILLTISPRKIHEENNLKRRRRRRRYVATAEHASYQTSRPMPHFALLRVERLLPYDADSPTAGVLKRGGGSALKGVADHCGIGRYVTVGEYGVRISAFPLFVLSPFLINGFFFVQCITSTPEIDIEPLFDSSHVFVPVFASLLIVF